MLTHCLLICFGWILRFFLGLDFRSSSSFFRFFLDPEESRRFFESLLRESCRRFSLFAFTGFVTYFTGVLNEFAYDKYFFNYNLACCWLENMKELTTCLDKNLTENWFFSEICYLRRFPFCTASIVHNFWNILIFFWFFSGYRQNFSGIFMTISTNDFPIFKTIRFI